MTEHQFTVGATAGALAGRALLLLACCAGMGLWTLLPAQELHPENQGCFNCHADEDADVMEFADGTEASIGVSQSAFLASAHGSLQCTACHAEFDLLEHIDVEKPAIVDYRAELEKRCQACHTSAGTAAARSDRLVDVTLHSGSKAGAPTCTSCHPAHSMSHGVAIPEMTSKTCAECHEETSTAYAASVHGGVLRGEEAPDVPVCTDCHPGHEQSGTTAIAAQVHRGRPCTGCHGDADLMAPYDISSKVVDTYFADFHGVSVGFYDKENAGSDSYSLACFDCHGIHDVGAISEDSAALMKANLVQVCRRCHEDASESFPDAWLSHYEPSLDRAPLVFLVRIGYLIFIPFVIIGLGIQIFMHLVLFPLRKRRRGDPAAVAGEVASATSGKPAPEQFVRFGLRSRVEHLAIMITFVLLLLSGLPQKFYDSDWAAWVIGALGGIDMARVIHRVTGIVFSALVVVHLALAIFNILRGKTRATMVPTAQDFRDAIQNLKYYLGKAVRPPRFDRFDYRQKFEYWGMMVGGAVMIVSGFMIYFPLLVADFLPGQFIPAAKTAHSFEAMMALLTIIIWHMYGAHLNPDCFPVDTSIFTGKISREKMMHEHPLEYERDHAPGQPKAKPSEASAGRAAGLDDGAAAPASPP